MPTRRPLVPALTSALAAALATMLLALGVPATGAAAPAATTAVRTTTSGPALTVPAAMLRRALHCEGDPRASAGTPVLLVPGTTLTPEEDFGWNYEPFFTGQGRAWCAVTLPGHAMGDIQVAAEYVVHAIRTLHRRAGTRIDVLGHSQGGMVPRWALKYWPDTRRMVDDLVGLAPSNHGTIDADGVCLPVVGCAPAFWQQRDTSAFITALNTGPETWPGISYTSVYTQLDEVVTPNLDETGSSSLHTGRGRIGNVAVQDVCPGHVADHLTIGTSDAVAHALALDALDHDGPADPARIDAGVCTQPFAPGITPQAFASGFGALGVGVAATVASYPHAAAEPPLRAYAR